MEIPNKTKDIFFNKNLVVLTDAAVAKIKAMMEKEGKQEGYGLRVGVVTGGCAGLSYDLRFQKNPYDNDTVIEQRDLRIFINAESLGFIKGLEIDYVDTLKESGFKYRNPNASSSCGCGTSFS
ncbi:MAG TPA: iron-sulfur cluster assembly accessory protein [Candidatus Omnitrophota bacterium]|nr:iron-sulfur cluster assembly accessory protein [Candidatus Omnitrophota bacterium]